RQDSVRVVSYDSLTNEHVPLNGPVPSSIDYVELTGNVVSPNPANRLGVGDFDSDRSDDLFLATGAGWYYAPAGRAAWRFLSAKTEKIDRLLFGDFDGDGRTDVFTVTGDGQLKVSWGGVSDWELLNRFVTLAGGTPEEIIANMAVGNFMGDQRSDLFLADGTNW